MDQYETFLRHINERGVQKGDRTGTGTKSVFGYQMRFDLAEGFPLVTTKRVHMKSVILELLWMLSGDTNVRWLQERGCTIWNEWADEHGELGPVYGKQWRSWENANGGMRAPVIDQITKLVWTLKANPDSRRMLVSAWNVGDLGLMALEPCHFAFQCYVAEGRLSLQVFQRSADAFLGVPFNIASYALLTHMLAQQCYLVPGELIWTGGDCHIYSNHQEQVDLQLSRDPRPYPLVSLRRKASIFYYELDDFEVVGYDPHPAIAAPVAV